MSDLKKAFQAKLQNLNLEVKLEKVVQGYIEDDLFFEKAGEFSPYHWQIVSSHSSGSGANRTSRLEAVVNNNNLYLKDGEQFVQTDAFSLANKPRKKRDKTTYFICS